MSNIDYLSQVVVGDMRDRGDGATEVMVDPATVIMVGKMIYTLIKAVKKCRKDGSEVKFLVNDLSQTRRVRRYINKAVRRQVGMRKMFSREAKELAQSIHNIAHETTERGFQGLIEEVG